MRRTLLKSKLHRATVTATRLDYEGSLTIDEDLLDAADILPNEQIHVWDVTNGTRLITYALVGERGSGVIQVNGAGAHLINSGDIVIIATFTTLSTRRAKRYTPNVILLDANNKVSDNQSELPDLPEESPPSVNGTPEPPATKERKRKS